MKYSTHTAFLLQPSQCTPTASNQYRELWGQIQKTCEHRSPFNDKLNSKEAHRSREQVIVVGNLHASSSLALSSSYQELTPCLLLVQLLVVVAVFSLSCFYLLANGSLA